MPTTMKSHRYFSWLSILMLLTLPIHLVQGQDLLRMRNGDAYQGTVAADSIEIQTSYGSLSFPRAQVAVIKLLEERRNGEMLITTQGDRFSGQLSAKEFQVTPLAAAELKVSKLELAEIQFVSDVPAANAAAVPDELEMRNQDRFHAKVSTPEFGLKTAYGELSFKQEDIQSLEMDLTLPLSGTVVLRDRKGVFKGSLGISEITLKTAADQELTISLDKIFRIDFGGSAPGKVFKDLLRDGSYGPEMVVIPAGQLPRQAGAVKGKNPNEANDSQQISIAKPFAIGRFEVTFEEFDRFCLATGRPYPSDEGWGRGNRPVINVAWKDAKAYAEWLAVETGHSYRLPSEAEWEYAARAGTASEYWWGVDIGVGHANCNDCGSRWDAEQTAPVGSFRANPFGLFDTAGNVWEWTEDCWSENYQNTPLDGSAYVGGDCRRHVRRGGSWDDEPERLRASHRFSNVGRRHPRVLGIRVARDL